MDDNRGFLREYFGVFFEKQTYLNLAYLLLALPLGVIYFAVLVTGFSLGFSLAIVLVGIPILFAMVGLMQALGRFERALNHVLLDGGTVGDGITLARESLRDLTVQGVMDHFRSGQFLKSGFYLFAKFPFGILAFTTAVTIVALAGGLILSPFAALLAGVSWDVFTSIPATLAAFVVGLFGAPVALRMLNALSAAWYDFGETMLDEPSPGHYRYVRVDDDEYDDPFTESTRKNDEKPKNEDSFAEDDPFYDDDLHIARVARERKAQDDDQQGG